MSQEFDMFTSLAWFAVGGLEALIMDGRLFRRALEYAQLFNLPVIQHCEDTHLSKGGVMHEGPVSARLGLKGIPSASEDTMVSRDLILAEMTGGKYHGACL